jgi:hypothetical protein
MGISPVLVSLRKRVSSGDVLAATKLFYLVTDVQHGGVINPVWGKDRSQEPTPEHRVCASL